MAALSHGRGLASGAAGARVWVGVGVEQGSNLVGAELGSVHWSSGTEAGTCVSEVAGGHGRGRSSLRDKDHHKNK